MLKNYLLVAVRNFLKRRIFSLINILGLSIGISAALIIYLIVQFEFSYENFRKDKDSVYRIVTQMNNPQAKQTFPIGGVEGPLPAALRNEATGMEAITHFITLFRSIGGDKITIPGNPLPTVLKRGKADITQIIYADEYYFRLFPHVWLAGSEQHALKEPNQAILTDERARLYFGHLRLEDIIGRQIVYEISRDTIVCTVTGIVKTLKGKATDFRFEEFISLKTLTEAQLANHSVADDWSIISNASQAFVKLKPGVKPLQIENQLTAIRAKHQEDKSNQGKDKDFAKHYLQPLNDIHFNQEYGPLLYGGRQAHKPTLYGLLLTAVLLLILGSINFINLTTAQSAQRAKEIGIRKTFGSGKRKLVFQFLTETFLLTLFATVLSIILSPLFFKIFRDFIPAEISFSFLGRYHVWLFLALLILCITFFSGLYPAWVLTRYKPVVSLKNQLYSGSSQTRGSWLRKTLTVFQFVVAQFILIATLAVSKQLYYSLNKDLGYNTQAIVSFFVPFDFDFSSPTSRRFVLAEKLKAIPSIDKISLAGDVPAGEFTLTQDLNFNTGKKNELLTTQIINTDPEYYKIFNLKLKSGRYPFPDNILKESLINEAFAKAVGFKNPEEALGKFIQWGNAKLLIVGVLADFHTKSTHESIKPIVALTSKSLNSHIHFSLKPQTNAPGLWKATLEKVEREFKQVYPDKDFEYRFFDETIASFYKKEQAARKLLAWSSGLCIIISCLGLLGLVIYITNVRTKEIAVRKILGASASQLTTLLSRELIVLVLLAFAIASPLAWIAVNKWLQNFSYRTDISWWLFGVCGVGMLLVAMTVLGVRTIKSAIANPVNALRSE
ncbi:MAG TPA: FtsX-like permease family protein [Chitinophagaceae bacterium]|nr:FtsX-like permease family protein [Chitinophagaceae bacterium]